MRLSAYGEVSDLGCINTQKKLCTRSRFAQKNYRCGIFWMLPGKFSFPDGSEYVWQRGVEGVKGQVTGGRSWPSFGDYPRRNCGVQKVTPPISLLRNEYNMGSNIETPGSIRFQAIWPKLAEWLWFWTPLDFMVHLNFFLLPNFEPL